MADLAGVKTVALSGSTSGTLTLRPAATTTNHTLTLPSAQGAASSLLQNNGSGTLTWAAASTADTVGPSSATDNAVARFDTTTGKLLQNSSVTISDTAGLAGVKTVALSGSTSGVLTLQPGATTTNHTLTLPSAQGAASSLLQNNGSGVLTWAAASTADAVGPGSATDNAVARFDTTTGKLLQNSSVTISDTADLAGVKTVALSGSTSGVLTLQPGATTTNHTLTLPSAQGAASSLLQNNGSGVLTWAAASTADTVGPSSATDNAVARFDTTTGKLLQGSSVTVSDTADLAGVKTVALSGSTSGVLTLQPGATTTNHTLTLPSAQGAASSLLQNDGSGTLTWAAASTADTVGPSSATDNAVARFDATTGKLLQNSSVTVSDTADLAGVKTVALSGSTSGVLTLQPGATTTNHTLTLPSAQGAASTVLQNDGSGTLSWVAQAGGGGGGGPIGIQRITASGTYTPTARTTRALVYATGSGGAGALASYTANNAAGSGGNGGGTYIGLFVIDDTKTGTVAIGAQATSSGATGGATTFLFPSSGTPSATITATGGPGGTSDVSASDENVALGSSSDAGGSATATNAVFLGGYAIEGSRGLAGFTWAPDYGMSGAGGRSFWAEGGAAQSPKERRKAYQHSTKKLFNDPNPPC
jgi:nitrous oxidase accessory protein NosD